jgi:IS5 family transposase
MKTGGLLARDWLEGELGDALHAVICGVDHNLRLILARLRALYCALLAALAELIHSDALRGSGLTLTRYRFAI